MTVEASKPEPSMIDRAVSRSLGKTYGQLTRRSFLSQVTRKLFALSGVTVAAQVLPYFVSTARADDNCGLHGYICNTGNCTGGAPGALWTQCCQFTTCPERWRCCKYTDYCGTRPPNLGQGCDGEIGDGQKWCGGTAGSYICTTVNCTGANHGSLAACETTCANTCDE